MAGGLVLKWGAIAGGILLVVVIIVACIAYFVGKNSAKKMQGGMNQHRIRAFDAHLPQLFLEFSLCKHMPPDKKRTD